MKTLLTVCLCIGALLTAVATAKAATGDVHFGRTLRQWRAQLQGENEFLRLYAARVLGQIGPRAMPALMEALKHQESGVRYWAAVGLGNVGPTARRAVPVLTKALKDASPMVRLGAATALWQIDRKPTAVTALIDALRDESETIRLYAVHALARIGPAASDAVPALTDALKDKNNYVRNAARQALKDIEGAPR